MPARADVDVCRANLAEEWIPAFSGMRRGRFEQDHSGEANAGVGST